MTWSFATDPEFQEQLDWADEFVRTEVEPIDLLIPTPYDLANPVRRALVPPLQERVRERGLWATHLGPNLGGPGYGQVKLALLNEVLGRSHNGPSVFGCQAPDSGNAEILAHYGTEQHKERYLEPLLRNEIVSAFSMTEPQGGADPTQFTCRAIRDGDEWVLRGEKWFSSNARHAAFLIVLAVTDPDASPHKRMSMFIVPTDTPGIEIVRNTGMVHQRPENGTHAYLRYHDVRVPADHLLGEVGGGFEVAQTRLGGGRIHHAMRTIGLVTKAYEMMCERVLSRTTKGSLLADKQLVQAMIADSWIEIQQFRLLVLQTAWKIDQYDDYRKVRVDIAAVKSAMPKVLHDVASRALQIHGSLGASNEMPFGAMVLESYHMGLADGPTEVHKISMATQLLKAHRPSDDLFPTGHLPKRRQEAIDRYQPLLEAQGVTF